MVRASAPHLAIEEDTEMPEPFRIWRTCKRYDALWWEGGISNQPYVMGLEHAACERASHLWQEELKGVTELINRVRQNAVKARSI